MIRRSFIQLHLGVALLVIAACEKAPEPQAAGEEPAVEVAAELEVLYHEFDEEFLALNPIFATFRGDHRFNDQLLRELPSIIWYY